MMMAKLQKVSSSRAREMQANPQEYFRKAREEANARAAQQLRAERQRAERSDQQSRQGLAAR